MPENLVPYNIADIDETEPFVASAATRIGHVHLKVANIDRALAFYQKVLGFEIITRYGDEAAFISAGGYHHHIGMNTWESLGGQPPAEGTTGLYHTAINYPTPSELLTVFERLLTFDVHIAWISDHGVSIAIYLYDPDQNGVELYWDRPRDAWPHDDAGKIAMFTERLDFPTFRTRIAQQA